MLALTHAAADPDLLHFAYGDRVPLGDEAVARRFVCERVPALLASESGVMLGVFDAAGGTLLGSTLLWNLNLGQGCGELGFWLAANARGRGVAARAIVITCRWGFDELGLHRIEALTDPAHPPSERVLRRVGFVYEGVRRGADKRPDGYHDCPSWSLLASDPRGPGQGIDLGSRVA